MNLNIDACHALRKEKALAVLDTINAAIESARASVSPGSTLRKAYEYASAVAEANPFSGPP